MNAGTTLGRLLEGLGCTLSTEHESVTVRDLTLDSRTVEPGTLFVALQGTKSHGLVFAAEAIRRGAVAVLYDPEEMANSHSSWPALPHQPGTLERPRLVPTVECPGLRAKLGEIARRFYGDPGRNLDLTAVTGTNGKTTVAWLLAQALRRIDRRGKAAYLGTLGIDRGAGERVPLERTTPDVLTVHRWCAQLRDEGVTRLVCEASSHALDQGRLDGLAIRVGVFTNLSPEHLDYHPTLEAYREAKWRLFERPELAYAVLNVGDECGRLFAERLAPPRTRHRKGFVGVVRFTTGEEEAEFRARDAVSDRTGTRFVLLGPGGESAPLRVGLLGSFNVENLLAVAAALHGVGCSFEGISSVLPELRPPPGRLEFVDVPEGPTVVVDFAHTPAALAAVLSVCRSLTRGRLTVVFGCGGDRDRGKRPVMGRLAAERADRVILTDDNPRNEDPDAITSEILSGVPSGAASVRVIHDRAEAIACALADAAEGDLVLLAGKGHEDTQVCGAKSWPFSDMGEVRARLGLSARARPC